MYLLKNIISIYSYILKLGKFIVIGQGFMASFDVHLHGSPGYVTNNY